MELELLGINMNDQIPQELILVVDDEPRNLRIIQKALDKKYNIDIAQNGKVALQKVEQERPAIVLLDIMLPDMDGYKVCEMIKQFEGSELTKVIFVSGKAMVQEKLKGYSVGAIDYMTKPFVREVLEAKLDVYLKQYRKEKLLIDSNFILQNQVNEYISKYGPL